MLTLVIVLLLLFVFSLTHGELTLSLLDVYHQLTHPNAAPSLPQTLFWQMRLPRSLSAIIAGGLLGATGAIMQSTTRNGLADPALLGIKEAACLVVWVEFLFFPQFSPAWRPLSAIIAGLAVTALVLTLARGVSTARFILIGIGVSWGLNASLGVILTLLDPKQAQQLLLWMTGSLQQASLAGVRLMCWVALPFFVVLLYTCRASNVLQLGRATASSLGVCPSKLMSLRIVCAVVLTAITVSSVGSIGFIGLMAPHLARRIVRGGDSYLFCASALIGALLLLLADNCGRLAFASTQVPAGVIVALIGGPFLLLLLWKNAARV